MVWNSEQSPLYRSVDRYNNTSTEYPTEENTEKTVTDKKCEDRNTERTEQHHGNCNGTLSQLTGDRDALLLVALIVLLLHEKADIKLIAALAFVLLG